MSASATHGGHNKSAGDKVERHHTVVELTKERKLKPFRHICRMREQRLVNMVMLGQDDWPRGRPARRWSNNCTLSEANSLATDRNECRRITGLNSPPGS